MSPSSPAPEEAVDLLTCTAADHLWLHGSSLNMDEGAAETYSKSTVRPQFAVLMENSSLEKPMVPGTRVH